MARPRKYQTEMSPTEREMAPETAMPVAELPPVPVYVPPPPLQPRQMRVEREGDRSEPYTRRFPQVRGGVCEYCGVMDGIYASHEQYKLCEHYRGMQLRCTYCPPGKNPDEIVAHAVLNIAAHPDNPNMLVVWCDSYECSREHEKRFKRNAA